MFFLGFGVIFILSTIDLMGLNVVLAVTEAGMCHLLLFAVDMSWKKNKRFNSKAHSPLGKTNMMQGEEKSFFGVVFIVTNPLIQSNYNNTIMLQNRSQSLQLLEEKSYCKLLLEGFWSVTFIKFSQQMQTKHCKP